MAPSYEAVVFDLDGTLLDTLDDLADSVNFALAAHGLPLRTRAEIQAFVGNGVSRLIELAVPAGKSSPEFACVLALFKEHYSAHAQDKTRPYPGISSMLKQLRQNGYRLGIVSNKFRDAVRALNAHYFGGQISVAIGETPDIRRKPAPDTLLCALDELDVHPRQAVYVGDSDVDIETARRAGVECISVSWGFRSREELLGCGATRIVDSPAALLELL